jgi:hypothetical protein
MLTRCNLLAYQAPLPTLGDLPDTTSVLAVLDKVDFLVVEKQAGPANATLVELLNALKTMNPTCKVFGRVLVGSAADLTAAQAAMDLWTTDVPAELLAGFCLSEVDFGGTATRANLNALVDKAHLASKGVLMDATNVFNVFEPYPGEAAPKFGRDPENRDYLLLHDFYLANQGPGQPALAESVEHRAGRADYLAGARVDRLTGIGPLNVGYLALVGAGNAAFLSEDTFKKALKAANELAFEGIGIEPDDAGATSHRFFLSQVGNQTLA